MDVSRLAPLDHVRSLYRDAHADLATHLAAAGIRERHIGRKADLVGAIKASPVPLTSAVAAAAAQGAPPQRRPRNGTGGGAAAAIDADVAAEKAARAEELADAAKRRSLDALEDAHNAASARCDLLKARLAQRQQRLEALLLDLGALRADAALIRDSAANARVLTGGHALGHDPLAMAVSMDEAASAVEGVTEGLTKELDTSHSVCEEVTSNESDNEDDGHFVSESGEEVRAAAIPTAPTRAQLSQLALGLSTQDTARMKELRREVKAVRRRVATCNLKKLTMEHMTNRLLRK
jgi:hypothetical protein